MARTTDFVSWFRSVAPYINAFRGKTFVIAFGGEVVADGNFVEFVHDCNLLASLGIHLIIVHGARPQIEYQLQQHDLEVIYVNGLRVTDIAALQCVKEAVGKIRVEIEALMSMGLPNSPMANAAIRIASGNFVIARPIGVLEGIDLMYTGEVRKINSSSIRARLENGEIVLLSPLGYSPTGEIFNLTLENVATEVAIAIQADKLIFLMNPLGITHESSEHGSTLWRELTIVEAKKQLKKFTTPIDLTDDIQLYLPSAVHACQNGVARVHLISRHIEGALLQELFTHEGIGSMITQGPLQTIRSAEIDDIGGILQLIEPLENEGVLVRRNRELLEIEIDRFTVLEHDNMIIGCAALYPFPDEDACELACLAVHPHYRKTGYASTLLKHIEHKARSQGNLKLFVLTTRTAHWFIERGFTETTPDKLPQSKQNLYNYQRRSKVFVKQI